MCIRDRKEGLDIDGARDFLAQDRDNFVQDEADEHLDSCLLYTS